MAWGKTILFRRQLVKMCMPQKTTGLRLVMWKKAQESLRPFSSSSLFLQTPGIRPCPAQPLLPQYL